MRSQLDIQPVDEILPLGKLTLLGIQHVLVMYAGAVAVPLIIGGALKLPKEQLAMLINADLWPGHPDPVPGRLALRHQAAGDDGRHLRRRQPHDRHGHQP